MLAYAIRRMLITCPTLVGVMLITFLLVRVSGDPARFVLGDMVSNEAIATFRTAHGLDRPIYAQFFGYVSNALHGDFGMSLRYQQPVMALFAERVPATLELGFSAYLVGIILGVLVGVYAAVRAGSIADTLVRICVLMGQAVPVFYLGLLLIILIAVPFRWFPTGGRGGLSHLVLPTIALSTTLTALIVRFTRSIALDVICQDFVRTARSKGLSEGTVLWKHVLRNVLVPLVTLLGLPLGNIISGAAVTETVFSWPGIGRFTIDAIYTRDYPVVQGTVFILTTVVVVLNLLVDISYAYLDPRVRYS